VLRRDRSNALCRAPARRAGLRGCVAVFVGTTDLVDEQLLGMPGGKRRHRQVGPVGIHTCASAGGDLCAPSPGARALIPALMYE